jgi:hypothetical protein
MKMQDVAFDEVGCIDDVVIEGQASPVTLVLSDALNAA